MRSITRSYYRNSVGGFLVFDITNRRSFEHVKDWLEEAKMHVQPFRIVFLLVGHKCDLASQRQIHQVDDNVINLHLKLSSGVGLGLKRKPSFPGKGNRNYIKFVLDEVFSPTEWRDVGQITPQVR
ncbi:hypothetical protein GH733_007002 [Mirounga leonina]|nr:hypothetical protein GH733_007002 [Mirounga leonina]